MQGLISRIFFIGHGGIVMEDKEVCILHPKVGLVCLSFDCNILDGILDTHANMDNPDDLFIGESREVVSITHARISCSRQGQVLMPISTKGSRSVRD